MMLKLSSVLGFLLLATPAQLAPGIKSHWEQPATYVAASPVQHYYLAYGSGHGAQQASSDDSSDSGENNKQTFSYSYAAPAPVSYQTQAVSYVAPVAVAAPAVQQVTYAAPAPAVQHYYVAKSEQKVRYGGQYGMKQTVSHDDGLEAHRRAVEEHQKAHAEALRRLEEARQKNKGTDSSESSEEEAPKRAYGTPQVVSYSTYDGPKVTKEETERLHAGAIAKQKELIARLEAINAQGPAKPDPNYKEPSDSSDSSESGEKGTTTYYYNQPAIHYAAPAAPAPVQEVTYQYYQQKPYTGPVVSRAETEYLHRDAIAKQQEMIRQQALLIQGVRKDSDSGEDSDEAYETKGADDAQMLKDIQNEKALLARQEAEVQAQTLLAKQQGEYAQAAGPAEGAYREDSSDSGEDTNSGAYGQKQDSSSESGSGEKTYTFVPVYNAPAQVGYSYTPVAQTAVYYQQPQQVAYQGPKVTKEETEALHAEAIAKQKAIVAQHEAFIARQRAALETRYSFQQKKDDSSESGEANKGYYAAGYYTAAAPAPATVHVVGPKVTNYVSAGYTPATFYAAPKPVTYVQPAAGVYAKDDSDSGEDQQREKAELSRQEAEVRAQIQLAKEQGAAAAAEGSSYKYKTGAQVVSYAVQKPAVVNTPVQYMYYRYARPTFGYYTPVVQKQTVVQAAPAPVAPATVYVQQPVAVQAYSAGGSSDDSDEAAW